MSYKDRIKTKGNRHIAYEHFIDRGYKPHLAAAIVGNLMQESHTRVDNTVVNKIGAVGIAQWLGARRTALKNFAKDKGKDYKDLNVQLDFLTWELEGGKNGWLSKADKDSFFNAKSIDEAANIFGRRFERPAEHELAMPTRQKYARTLAQEYGDYNIYSKDDEGNILVAQGSEKIAGRRSQFAKGNPEEKEVDNTYAQGPYTGKYATKEGWEEMTEEDFKISDAAKREYYDKALSDMEELDRQERAKAQNTKVSASTQKLEEEIFVEAVAEATPTHQQQQQDALQEEVKSRVLGKEAQPEQQQDPSAATQPQEEANLYDIESIAENEFLAQMLGEEFRDGGKIKRKELEFIDAIFENNLEEGGENPTPKQGKGFIAGVRQGLSQSPLNPKNWGVEDYSNNKTFNEAYEVAKKAGETEFIYNNKRFNTKSDLIPKAEFERYGINYAQASSNNWLRDRIQKNISPNENQYGYSGYSGEDGEGDAGVIDMARELGRDFIKGKRAQDSSALGNDDVSQDIFNLYLGKPINNSNKNIKVSSFRPSKSKEDGNIYYTKDDIWGDIETHDLLNEDSWENNKIRNYDYNLGNYTISRGEDEKGKYISYYDKWDLHPTGQSKLNPLNYAEQLGLSKDQSQGLGKPVEFYDRKYYTTNEYGQIVFDENKPKVIRAKPTLKSKPKASK